MIRHFSRGYHKSSLDQILFTLKVNLAATKEPLDIVIAGSAIVVVRPGQLVMIKHPREEGVRLAILEGQVVIMK